jgi:type 2 lantibiotic biosynthesis protein LanM
MYKWGLEARPLLVEWANECANDSIRVILRATQDYSSLLHASFHPDWLRDALDRDRLLDRLWVPYHYWPELAAVYALERQQLASGDIPIFYTAVASQQLHYGETAVDNIVRHSALFQTQNRLRILSEADLYRQRWLLRNAINANSFVREERPFSTYQLPTAAAPATPAQLLQWSQRIADQLRALCFETAYEATWFNPVILNFYQRYWKIGPVNFDLYDGLSGPALFFAYLSAVTEQPAYATLAQKVLTRARKNLAYHQQTRPVQQIGGFVGLGGYIYTLAHLGALWQQPALWREAEALLPTVNALIEADEQFGVIDGSAGCILALRSLYHCAPSAQILDSMNRCGQHLCNHAEKMPSGHAWLIRGDAEQEKPLTGFSHGTSGIAYALAALAQETGNAAYDELADEALLYDNSHFSAEKQNWIDVRSEYADYASQVREDQPMAWCHGTPGIGLARVGIASVRATSPTLANDIEIAVQKTQADGFGTNHTLCHGDLGNLDLLLSAGQILPNEAYNRQTYRIAAQILASLDEHGCIDASPLTIETIGLMTGITGAGYELLRLAYPDKVPSVLLLEPPILSD